MKQILFTLLLTLSPYLLIAQSHLTILGGAAVTFMPEYLQSDNTAAFNSNFTVKYDITKSRTTFGIRIDAYNLSSVINYAGIDKNGSLFSSSEKVVFIKPAIMPSVYLGTHIPFDKNNLFFGIDMGAIFAFNGKGIPRDVTIGYGFIIGGHIGYSYSISNNISIVGELTPRYIGLLNIDYNNTFALPLAFGLSFSI